MQLTPGNSMVIVRVDLITDVNSPLNRVDDVLACGKFVRNEILVDFAGEDVHLSLSKDPGG